MRTFRLLFAALSVASVNPTLTHGQNADQRPTEEQIESYHKHQDVRHGHDHSYPDRGAIVRDLPQGAVVVNYAGLSYRFHDGIWFEPRGPAFMVVAPPVGLIVPSLPTFATVLAHGGTLYLYCNDAYYRPRPDLGGYEVVNDPSDTTPKSETTVGARPAAAPDVASKAAAPTLASSSAVIGPPIPAPVPIPAATAPVSGSAVAATPPVPGLASTTAATPTGTTPSIPEPAAKTASATIAAPAKPAVPATTDAPAAPAPSLPVLAAATTGSAAIAAPSIPATGTAPSVATPAATTAPVTLQSGSPSSSVSSPRGGKTELSPRNGQTADQQARDRYECYRFAVAQSGFDPIRAAGGVSSERQSNYERAQAACFDARGYTAK